MTAVGAAAAAGYGLTAPKRYRATAQVLVTPVSASDPTFAGLDLLRDASGRRTAAEDAAVLVRSPQVAEAVRAQLGLRRTSGALLGELHPRVEPKSDIVDVTVEDTSPAAAAQLANAFVDALIAQRTASFQTRLSSAIRRDEQLLAARPSGAQAAELGRRVAQLRSFQGQPDPTLRRASTAAAPASASWPDLSALIGTGAGAGLALGALIVLGLLVLRRSRADRLEQRLAARESGLAARQRDLQAKIDELRALDSEGFAERERREVELARREESLARREAELEARSAALGEQQRRPAEGPTPEAPAP